MWRRGALLVGVLVVSGCAADKPEPARAPAEPSELREGRDFLAAGQADQVLARLQNSQAPEALYLKAESWAKKAETAPLPTPEALSPDSPKDAVLKAPEFKPEELEAIALYEQAAQALPQDPRPHLGLARLLAPHAQRQYDAQQAASAAPVRKPMKGKPAAEPTPSPVPSGPDFSPERVAREYRAAAEAAPADAAALDALYAFAVRVGQLDHAAWTLEVRMKREPENPDHALRYGDFLREVKKDPLAAIAAYRQVLIWRADDAAVKARMADIYIDLGVAHHANGEYATADARYQDAQKWIVDRSSPQAQRLAREVERLRRLRR